MPLNDGTVKLNNYLQSINKEALLSWEDIPSGPRHAPQWTSICKLSGVKIGEGTGTHKHLAKDAAAKAALETLMATEAVEG